MQTQKVKIFRALIILLFIAAVFYALIRSAFLFYAQYTPLEKVLGILFLLSELFLMFHAVGYFLTVYRMEQDAVSSKDIPELAEFPPVAVLVAARHEPKNILRQTLRAIQDMNYPKKSVYLLDDSSDEAFIRQAEELSQELGVNVYRRKERHGAKAGIINDCVRGLSEKYIVIFDADQCPIPSFLSKTVPLLEQDPRLAFVQTPQFYTNIKATRVAEAANFQQAVFYEYVCEGKSSGQSMICCGTNVVFRKDALLEVGGLDESTVTEDFATSIKLHLKKWRSLYVNHVSVFGRGPEDLGSYLKQQNRWALGNVTVLRKVLIEFIKKPWAMNLLQWFEYGITGSYYFVGWAYTFLIFCPILYILFDVPSFFLNPVVYFLTFIPYFVLSLAIFYGCMHGRNYSLAQLWKAQMLSFITMPVYMRASLLGLLGIKVPFQVTVKKGGARNLSYIHLWPQLLLWTLNLVALTWAAHRFYYERSMSIGVNCLWIGYHFLLLSSLFYFNEMEYSFETFPRIPGKYFFQYRVIGQEQELVESASMTDRHCFRVDLPDAVPAGSKLMCKISQAKTDRRIIFDGKVVWVSPKRRKGCTAGVRIVKITENDLSRLNEWIKP